MELPTCPRASPPGMCRRGHTFRATPTVAWPPKNRRGERVGRQGQGEIGSRIEVRAQVHVEIDGDFADRDLARPRHVGSGRHAGMIIDGRERPSRLQRSCREAAEEAGDPKLTPPSSASDACETSASAAAKAPVEIRRVRCARLVRDVACDAVHVVVRSMSAPRPSVTLGTGEGAAAQATNSSDDECDSRVRHAHAPWPA